MPKSPPPRAQLPLSFGVPSTVREVYAEALKAAEREFREAQVALSADDSNAARERYAKALATYDRLQGAFPFIAAGLSGDVEA